MPKQSYGAVPKGRSQSLLFALLDLANDSLDGDEATVERLQSQIKTHWQSSTRLVIRTKLRYLQTLSLLSNPDAPLTLPQIKMALKHLADFLGILEDNRTMTRGSENWHFTLTFWRDRWDREGNLQGFEQTWETRRSGASGKVMSDKQVANAKDKASDILKKWREICQEALNTRLTSNPLTAGDGMVFELRDLYVPLGVVTDDLSEDNSESPSYEPQALLARYANESEIRIAIVGEPGGGKTTFLQQLALLLAQTPNCLPVWVTLADLEGRSLEDYLTTTWLRKGLKQFTISPDTLREFAGLIEAGRIWLLLDALDEIGGQSSRVATNLEREIQGWLGNASIILTCRNTIWNGGKNALGYFETYRCQSFTDDQLSDNNQIQLFIKQWFEPKPELGDRLSQELDRRVNRRIREVVRHPLYLTLLCRTWQLTKGKLPTTKAILYRQFVEALYDWKQDAFPTRRSQRQSLNQTLAQLALQGMRQNPPRFRFQQGEIEQCFDPIDPELLTLALQLGWLDVVGHAEATGEKVYRFYHPTFQEYFAATAIAHWQDFIRFEGDEQTIYPIFEFSWQEIILLWLGREDIDHTDKEAFLQTLMQWQDNCGGFYDVRAICLVGQGLAEFSDFSAAQTVITQLVQWRFSIPKGAEALPTPIVEQAGIALSRSDRRLTIPALEAFLQHSENPFEKWLAAHSLGKNHDFGSPMAIATLEQLLVEEIDVSAKLNFCRSLGLIAPKNQTLLQTLTHLLKTEANVSILRKTALRLGKLSPNHPLAIQTLETLLQEATEAHQRSNIIDTLSQIAPQHPLVSSYPRSKFTSNKPRKSKQKSSRELQLAAETILKKLDNNLPLHKRIYLISKLATYNPSHPEIIPNLIEGLAITRRKTTLKLIIETLSSIVEGDRLVVIFPKVRDIYLNPQTRIPSKRACYKLLWDYSKELGYSDFQRLWNKNYTNRQNDSSLETIV